MTEAEYTEAFHRHFKRTVSFLHIKYRVPTAEAAKEFALEGWANVWKYREKFDPGLSSIETFANICCFQIMVKRRSKLWAKASVCSIEKYKRRMNRGTEVEMLPKALQQDPDMAQINRLDAELILSRCRDQDARVLRRYYLQELPVPRSSLSRARVNARECAMSIRCF